MARPPLLLLAALLAGCPEEVPPPGDTEAPTVIVYGVTPTGSRVEPVDGVFLVPTAELSVHIEASEAATVFYTTDGAEPGPRTGGLARNAAVLPLVDDTQVRWVAQDLAGNLGEPGEVRLRFDREAPVVEVDPAGGDFPGPIEVTVTVSEPVTVWWTTDGVAPVPGGDRGERAEAGPDQPLRIALVRDTTLRLLAIDVAGNSFTQPALVYTIDDRPPATRATPPEGHYVSPIAVTLTADEPGTVIRYTLDGTAPGPESLEYLAPIPLAGPTMLRFRGTDAGGNVEDVQAADYTIGARPRADPRVEPDALGVPTEGGLWLAAALLDAAGTLGDGAGGFGRDWTAWAVGRSAIDAVLFQSGVGIHAQYGPAIAAVEAVDEDGDGATLDDAWAARSAALAAAAGSPPPVGAHPVALPYLRGLAAFLRPPPAALTPDGRPLWEEDFTTLRWEGARGSDRVVTPGTTAAALRAYVARARAGTAGQHRPGAGRLGSVEPVWSLRCGGCHQPGAAEPALPDAQAYLDTGLVLPGDSLHSPLTSLLAGDHYPDRASPAQIAAVRAWIDAGAVFGPGEESPPAIGSSGREGVLGLWAVDAAAQLLGLVADVAFYDPAAGALAPLAPGRYHVARAGVTEAEAGAGQPRRLETIRAEGPAFDTRGHARLLLALAAAADLEADRPAVFALDVLGGEAGLGDAARRFVPTVRAALRDHGEVPGGGFGTTGLPTEPQAEVDALATAEAAVALVASGELEAASLAVAALRALVDDEGDVVEAGRPALEVQLAALHAFAAVADGGDEGARRAAVALWERLEAAWWDAGIGTWQTTRGVPAYAWTPDLAARAIDALGAAQRLGLPGAADRRAAIFDRVVLGGLLIAESWLTGEFNAERDTDGDGVPGLLGTPPDGAAPVFRRLVTF